ncbi:hypothetical protein [Mucilaginibacter sp. NFX135]
MKTLFILLEMAGCLQLTSILAQKDAVTGNFVQKLITDEYAFAADR